MRDALTYLEQCAYYSSDLSLANVKEVLGDITYETMCRLTNCINDRDESGVISIIENMYQQGRDLKAFINSYLAFVLDLNKYLLFKNIDLTSIPKYMETTSENNINIRYTVSIGNNAQEALSWYNRLADRILEIKAAIRYDNSYKNTIIVYLLKSCRGL